MKNIIFGVLVFLIFIGTAYADVDTSLYRFRYDNGSEVITKRFEKLDKYFDLYLDEEVKITDYKVLNNMAYYGASYNYPFEKIITQVMIWEYVYPNYSFEVIDNDEKVVNLEYYRNSMNHYLDYYVAPCILDGLVNVVELGGSITYQGKYRMSAYSADKYDISIDKKTIDVSNITGVGTNILQFRVNEIVENNKITSIGPSMGEFSTTIIVLGNRINFDVSNNDAFIFELYDNDTNELLGVYNINQDNNYIEYSLNKNVRLVDITNSPNYELFNDIIINEDDNHIYNIELRPNYYNKRINFQAPLINEKYNIVNIDIYDDNELVDNVLCNETCYIELKYGNYKLINNNTNENLNIFLEDNIEFDLSNNYLNALKGKYNINHIYVDDQKIPFHINNEYIFLDEYVISSSLRLEIDNNIYEIYLNDLLYEKNFGLIKELNIKLINNTNKEVADENNNDSQYEIVNEKEAEESLFDQSVVNDKEEVIEIEIPNTEDDNNEYYEYIKKMYNFNSKYSTNYNN